MRLFARENSFIYLAIILFLGFYCYLSSMSGEFLWDDTELIEENYLIKDFKNVGEIFTTSMWAGAGVNSSYYRPLTMFVYMVDYSIGKLDVRVYHFTNVFIHICVAFFLYWLITLLFGDKLLSFITSVLFVVHPIHTEAVGYISGLQDLLSAGFMLLTFIAYIKLSQSKKVKFYFITALAYALALLSKETPIMLPAILIVYHYLFKVKMKRPAYACVLTTAFAYLFLRFFILESSAPSVGVFSTVWQRVPGIFVALTNYFRLLIVPFNLQVDYGAKIFSFSNLQASLGVGIVAAALWYAFIQRRLRPAQSFSILWFFIFFLPVSNIYPLAFYMAEHFMYFPSMGFFLIAAIGCKVLLKESKYFGVVLAGIIIVFSATTYNYNRYWVDPVQLYERAIKLSPDKPKSYNNLGNYYRKIGEHEKAVKYLEKVLELGVGNSVVYNNLGISYSLIGEYEKAAVALEAALEYNPKYFRAYNNLGNLFYLTERPETAIKMYKKALDINPNFSKAYFNIGSINSELGRYEESRKAFKEAVRINPDFARAHYSLGEIYSKVGETEKSAASFMRALEIDPDLKMIKSPEDSGE